jgi:hypothetical protein
MRNAKAIFGTLICAVIVLFTAAAYGHEYNQGYISWGVDEFELFGLNQSELSQQFKNKLTFDQDYTHAWLGRGIGGSHQFLLTFKNNRVCEVQRQLRDGAGCNLMGCVFSSKEEALRFTIDGLSKLSPLTPEEVKTLAVAKKMLLEIERAKTRKDR